MLLCKSMSIIFISWCYYSGIKVTCPTQGVYNCLLLVPIVGGACFLCHKLAAVFNVSLSVFWMTSQISRMNTMGRGGDFCDIAPTY